MSGSPFGRRRKTLCEARERVSEAHTTRIGSARLPPDSERDSEACMASSTDTSAPERPHPEGPNPLGGTLLSLPDRTRGQKTRGCASPFRSRQPLPTPGPAHPIGAAPVAAGPAGRAHAGPRARARIWKRDSKTKPSCLNTFTRAGEHGYLEAAAAGLRLASGCGLGAK